LQKFLELKQKIWYVFLGYVDSFLKTVNTVLLNEHNEPLKLIGVRLYRSQHSKSVQTDTITDESEMSRVFVVGLRAKGIVRPLGGKLKRVFDFIFSLFASVLLLPLFVITAVGLKLTAPGPIIFKHTRVGFGGQKFSCLKFRTMIVEADKTFNALLDANADARAEWERCHKLAYDPRITPVGRLLRLTSIDELPQLMNVLRGEMSLVGPRPITPSEMPRYGTKLALYLSARPGLTGRWQISGRSDCDFTTRVELDAEYVSRWSFSRDLFIMFQTVVVVLSRKGSY
jgi:exopolysaccharide production protein ExoY